ncbi:MAG TPA: histidinol dehydrogenase [Thermomicrobiales bacterium]|nr:histidinol dehydrogenase [Thermomicrobiales bacterium]
MATSTITIRRIENFDEALAELTRRGSFLDPQLSDRIREGIRQVFGEDLSAREVVERIVTDVRSQGDAALRRYTEAFDGQTRDSFEVPKDDWRSARERLDADVVAAMETAVGRIQAFHERQPGRSWLHPTPQGTFGQIVRPLERVGLYTPGGTAAYPSSLLMSAVPARVAGVQEVVIATPPARDGRIAPTILAAADIAAADRVFAMGGAQAIAALAFGTETVPHVDKIFGPGNIFVTLAKQRVYGVVDLDQLAGPTETLLIADETADVELVAADLIAQSEHDTIASALLITTSVGLADAVPNEIERQIAELERAYIIRASMSTNGRIIVTGTLDEAVRLANAYAPEHLCLLTARPWDLVPNVENAGGIFVGEDSPEALGDYTAGPSHVMPTGGTARFSSPVHVGEFQKVISLLAASPQAVDELGEATIELANAEGLTGHASAIRRRLEKRKKP